ncbi:hypothetical protein QBC39DRAFT_332001 [Podospora conica]|nr:hypothetical protein QBC39DRAFT_332001 [Schizothecium conicum]
MGLLPNFETLTIHPATARAERVHRVNPPPQTPHTPPIVPGIPQRRPGYVRPKVFHCGHRVSAGGVIEPVPGVHIDWPTIRTTLSPDKICPDCEERFEEETAIATRWLIRHGETEFVTDNGETASAAANPEWFDTLPTGGNRGQSGMPGRRRWSNSWHPYGINPHRRRPALKSGLHRAVVRPNLQPEDAQGQIIVPIRVQTMWEHVDGCHMCYVPARRPPPPHRLPTWDQVSPCQILRSYYPSLIRNSTGTAESPPSDPTGRATSTLRKPGQIGRPRLTEGNQIMNILGLPIPTLGTRHHVVLVTTHFLGTSCCRHHCPRYRASKIIARL